MPAEPSSGRRADGAGRVNAGRIVGPFGLRGELKVDASRVGLDALRPGLAVVLAFDDGDTRDAVVEAVRLHKGRPLIRIAGIGDATGAQALGCPSILLASADAPLDDGEYFDADLIGCDLVDDAGALRGTVADVQHYPAQDMLVIHPGNALLPLVAAFIRTVDIAHKTIRIDVPPGLLDPGEAAEA